jgi:selenide,water dikinase
MTNAAARPGDVLVLTKPLGTGVIATALKAGQATDAAAAAASRSMATLNRIPAAVARRHGVRAATDVTGFGLCGHAANIARESGVTLELEVAALPLLPDALALAPVHQPRGLRANRERFEALVEYRHVPPDALRALLFDPQTSGGLLLCVPADQASSVLADLPHARAVGRVVPSATHPLRAT